MASASNSNISRKEMKQLILRISDMAEEPLEMLPPISGYEETPIVSLENAVKPLIPFVADVESYAYSAKELCTDPPADGLTVDESASIMLYSMGWKPLDKCLYVALNATLQSKDRKKSEPWFLYLKLFLTALSRLPSTHQSVFRGVKLDLHTDYPKDKTIVWWGFSSCTVSVDVLRSEVFLGTTSERTLFIIECNSGKNIRKHSYYQSEDEILLLAATQFKVRGCLNQDNGLYIIQLQETQPYFPLLNLVLPSSQSKKSSSDKLIYVSNYDFNGTSTTGELTFRKGDRLAILDRHSYNDWWQAENLRTKQVGYAPKNYISLINDLITCEWYFTKTNRWDAERFLGQAHNEKGTFLIRPSDTSPDGYSLCVLDSNKDKHFSVKHYRIKRTDQGLYYISSSTHFPTLQHLVDHYRTNVDGLCCLLTRPCQKIEAAIPNDLLELDRSQLFDMELLNRGKYSEIFKGKFGQRVVAIKSMERDYKNHLPDADKFLNEAKIMKDFLHENILRLYGVCSQQGPVLIVTEFIDNGCLLNYLRSKQGKDLKFQKLLDFAAQIAKGMNYLEEKQCVHCNLAARNILVGEFDVIKIGDFRLAKILQGDHLSVDPELLIPTKWTALEVVTRKEYTSKSDVWSFGVLLYELITHGSNPYPGMLDNEAFQKVLYGYRMSKPNDCDEYYYQIMCSCWDVNPVHRPTFERLYLCFHEFMVESEPEYEEA